MEQDGSRSEGRAMAIFHDQVEIGDSPIGPPLPFTCEGSSSVSPARRLRIEISCAGPLFSVAPARATGAISTDRKTLIFSYTEPTIEKLTVGDDVIAERICIGSDTDVKAIRRN